MLFQNIGMLIKKTFTLILFIILASNVSDLKGAENQNKPNVIYITADGLGTKLGCYGYKKVVTPNIDQFAKEALLFERCYAQVGNSSASRTSIMTGTRPSTTNITETEHDWKKKMPGVVSMPGMFKIHGYYTYSVGKIFDPESGPGDLPWEKQVSPSGIESKEEVIKAIDELAQLDKPFFLGIGFRQPFCPWEPTEESLRLYDTLNTEADGKGRLIHNMELIECTDAGKLIITDEEAAGINKRFLASISDLDRGVGAILNYLKKMGLYDNSIIIFWSGSTGYHLGENFLWGNETCYSEAMHVPLLMKIPGMRSSGERAAGIIECVDMYPTLNNIIGFPRPLHELEGISFLDLFFDPGRDWKKGAFSQVGGKAYSIKTEKYNYISYPDGREELFDLEIDPDETNNIAGKDFELTKEISRMLMEGWRKSIPAGWK